MHSLPGEDIQRQPVYEKDACRAGDAEEDSDSADEQAVDGDEGTGSDGSGAAPTSRAALSPQGEGGVVGGAAAAGGTGTGRGGASKATSVWYGVTHAAGLSDHDAVFCHVDLCFD